MTALSPRCSFSGTALKTIACITMLIDHIGASCIEAGILTPGLDSGTLSRDTLSTYPLYRLDMVLRFTGRLAFPLFCFLLVEGFVHTHNVKGYLGRLVLFGLLSEVPFDLAFFRTPFFPGAQNVYWTLALGVLAMAGLRHFEKENGLPGWQGLVWAGIFVGVTGRSSAEAVAYFLLSIAPVKLAVAVLFVVACFVSMAMGTSVGTITLLAPIAVAVSADSGFDLPLCIASVMGGAMFGDNLSFISDTTIAACSTQGTEMKDKFRANFKIALPAALAALALIIVVSLGTDVQSAVSGGHDLVLIIPYVLVLIGGIVGLNVFVVLLIGIAAGAAITLITGQVTALELMGNMGGGVSGMFETILVTLLVASLCGLIRAYGGFESILAFIRRVFRGKRGGQLGIGLLVGLMDIATANNTVAIVMAGPIAKEVAEEYGISPKRSASLLDTFSCIFQGIIPYGAQMLVAISTCATLGYAISAFDIIPLLFYPFLLCLSSLLFILFDKK